MLSTTVLNFHGVKDVEQIGIISFETDTEKFEMY
jgi:hypothetical protein